ncbi:MAG: undecaprenyldiphospho-muramoylpentapeptide beta-N-acetylglucosaminyltransferase [Alphaproteobacteria bacterium]|nr:undecaprenyldiphospho-muramoylpentapeptide beta-N-acetylglucosaminyltransferase [Alphaproteobacteria bacterium]
MTMRRMIVLAAGGTGGHMFPARALAEVLIERGHGVALVTDRRGQGFEEMGNRVSVHRVRAERLGSGLVAKIGGVVELVVGTIQARRILREMNASLVVGFGGYPSLPAMAAALRLGIPTMLHEQNAVLGRANRLLAPCAKRIATSYPHVAAVRAVDRLKLHLTGNPVRPAIAALRDRPYPAPAPVDTIRLLVTGGSQGARVFGDLVPEAIALMSEPMRRRLFVEQQCLIDDMPIAEARYREIGVNAELAPFFTDLPERLARAHLVICRAGASTVAELTIAGRPAVLVPYPYATDDHQTANAHALEAAGGAWIMPQDKCDPERLAHRLKSLIAAPRMLVQAAEYAHGQGRPNAADRLADLVEATIADPHIPKTQPTEAAA